ncbi:hypothetical protein ACFV4M_01970 [Kitasatospora indigofera]|uniref:hypothetical protein n=1 Tax=Kitasatospora indigofera TaxID=67307 RepID=UPI00365F648A
MDRRFTFTITVCDRNGNVVTTVNGHTVVTDPTKPQAAIAQGIIDDLPGQLRQPGYQHHLMLSQS